MQITLHTSGVRIVGKKSSLSVAQRRVRLIKLMAEEPRSVEELVERLRASRRTVLVDLKALRIAFPEQLKSSRGKAMHGTGRVSYSWSGEAPYLLERPIHWLSERELIALVAGRGLLRNANPNAVATSRFRTGRDYFADTIDNLIERAGVADAAKILARDVVAVSRFGAAPVDPGLLADCLSATALAGGLEFDYVNLLGDHKRRTVAPLRMVIIKGEWYCLAWELESKSDAKKGKVKTFRLERMTNYHRTWKPTRSPSAFARDEVDQLLDSCFFATGSLDTNQKRRVALQISPKAWPFVKDRRWGDHQKIEMKGAGLEPGWIRLRFSTSGIDECKHWVLGMGITVRAEEPLELVEWIQSQVQALAEAMV